MAAHIVRLGPSTIGVVDVGALYSGGEVEREVKEHLISAINSSTQAGRIGLQCQACEELVADLHKLFLEKGDREEYRQQYGSEGFMWYMASSELSIANLKDRFVRFCHVGTIHVYHYSYQTHETRLIMPVHNVQSELEAGTSEESCLSPFVSRSNREIAEQILVHSRDLVPRLEAMDRDQFYSAIGHVLTRVVGYYQDPIDLKPGVYRKETPKPFFSSIQTEVDDFILFYLPTVRESIPFSRPRIFERISTLFREGQRLVKDSADVLIDHGQLVGVDIASDGTWGEIVTFS